MHDRGLTKQATLLRVDRFDFFDPDLDLGVRRHPPVPARVKRDRADHRALGHAVALELVAEEAAQELEHPLLDLGDRVLTLADPRLRAGTKRVPCHEDDLVCREAEPREVVEEEVVQFVRTVEVFRDLRRLRLPFFERLKLRARVLVCDVVDEFPLVSFGARVSEPVEEVANERLRNAALHVVVRSVIREHRAPAKRELSHGTRPVNDAAVPPRERRERHEARDRLYVLEGCLLETRTVVPRLVEVVAERVQDLSRERLDRHFVARDTESFHQLDRKILGLASGSEPRHRDRDHVRAWQTELVHHDRRDLQRERRVLSARDADHQLAHVRWQRLEFVTERFDHDRFDLGAPRVPIFWIARNERMRRDEAHEVALHVRNSGIRRADDAHLFTEIARALLEAVRHETIFANRLKIDVSCQDAALPVETVATLDEEASAIRDHAVATEHETARRVARADRRIHVRAVAERRRAEHNVAQTRVAFADEIVRRGEVRDERRPRHHLDRSGRNFRPPVFADLDPDLEVGAETLYEDVGTERHVLIAEPN